LLKLARVSGGAMLLLTAIIMINAMWRWYVLLKRPKPSVFMTELGHVEKKPNER